MLWLKVQGGQQRLDEGLAQAKLASTTQLLTQSETLVKQQQTELMSCKVDLTRVQTQLEHAQALNEERLGLLADAQQRMESTFKALASDTLKSNSSIFLEMARTSLTRYQDKALAEFSNKEQAIGALLEPIRQALTSVDDKMKQIELDRTASYAGLTEQVQNLAKGQLTLQKETSGLVQALRAPQVRGRWGEIQLKRVVELAGMLDYCDFLTQVSANADGGKLIPDMVVRLPGGKQIVIDSKCPLQAYLDALNADRPEEKIRLLKLHAAHVAGHILKLSQKAYWEQFQPAPEFVILFLPGETFFSAALEQDPSLIESGVQQRVILATPTTLIALLRAVSFGWQQEKVTRNVQEICELGRQACDRARVVTEHLASVGSHLSSAVKAYNSCAVSLESRLLGTLRKFKDSGVAMDKEIPIPKVVDRLPALLDNGAQVLPGFDEDGN